MAPEFKTHFLGWCLLQFSILLTLSSGVEAQGHAPSVQPSFAQPIGTPARGMQFHGGFRVARPHRHESLLLAAPYLDDYADDSTEPAPDRPPQATPPVAVREIPSPAPAEPLVLEVQGDHWVRVDHATGSATPRSGLSAYPASAPAAPVAAVLVFADGHQEEVSRYMIVGNILYANSDYWTTGTWTKRILLSSLDLPASLRANQARGSKLLLPGGPNEVVIGP